MASAMLLNHRDRCSGQGMVCGAAPAVVPAGRRSGYTGLSVTLRPSALTPSQQRLVRLRLRSELASVRRVLARIDAWRLQRASRVSCAPAASTAEEELSRVRSEALLQCSAILGRLRRQRNCCRWFGAPVDAAGLGLYDYFKVVKNPMDLGTVKNNLAAGKYHSPSSFARDVRLTFTNAMLYNPAGHPVHQRAVKLLNDFDTLYAPVEKSYRREILAAKLHSMPRGVMANVVAIVQRRGLMVERDGDDAVLSIEALDDGAVAEIERFISGCKNAEHKTAVEHKKVEHKNSAACRKAEAIEVADLPPDVDASGDEYVVICDEVSVVNCTAIEIEKDDAMAAGKSSSSSSGSSSSSDSDSESSSGSESSADAKGNAAVPRYPVDILSIC